MISCASGIFKLHKSHVKKVMADNFLKGQHYSKFHVIYEYDILEEWDIVHPLPVQILYVKKSSMVEILMKFALTFLMH